MINIRKARQIAFDLNLGRYTRHSLSDIRAAFHRLDRSQPEKGNRLIVQSDRKAAKMIWDNMTAIEERHRDQREWVSRITGWRAS